MSTRREFLTGACAVSLAGSTFADSVSPPITALSFSPDGALIIAGSQAGLKLIDAATGTERKSIDVDMDNVHDVQFAPDGKTLAVAGGNPGETGVIELLNWPALSRQQKLRIHDDVIYSIDFSATGSHWVAASGDQVCSVYKLASAKPATRFTRHSRGVMSAAFLPDSETIVSGSRDETLRVWDATTGENLRTLHNHSRDVLSLAVKKTSAGLPIVASASSDLTVRFWQPTIGRMVRFARLPSEPLCIGWCAGQNLIAGCRDGQARIINSQTVKLDRTIDVSAGWLYCVAVSPINDRQIALGSNDARVNRLDLG